MLSGASILLAHNPKLIWFIEIALTENQPKGGGKINPDFKSIYELFIEMGCRAYTTDDQ